MPSFCLIRWRHLAAGLIVSAAPLVASIAEADKPAVSRIFPAGGQRGTTVTVACSGQLDLQTTQVWTSQPGLQWDASDAANEYRVTIAEQAVPGVTYVRFFNPDGASELYPFLIGTIPEASESEPNDTPATANLLEDSTRLVNGVLEKRGDTDNFRVAVKAGQTLVASVVANNQLDAPLDATLQLVSPDGHVIADNLDYHGLDPQIVWTADRDQQLIVRVFAFPAAPNSTIALAGGSDYLYRLTVTTGPFLEGVLPLAVSTTTDFDLRPIGWNWEGAGAELQKQSHAAADRFVCFAPQGARELTVPVVDTPVVVAASPAGDGGEGMQVIELPVDLSGHLAQDGQLDRFEFEAAKGVAWDIDLQSRRLGFPLDAVIEIEDAETGKLLKREDDSSRQPDPQFRWQAPSDGRYRLSVFDVNQFGGVGYLYRLSILPVRPRVQLSVAADQFSGKVGEAIEVVVKVDRQNGFDLPLAFELLGAEGRVKLTSVTSEPMGETAKEVKLQLQAEAVWQGPIQLVARAQAEPNIRYPVEATPLQLTQLWLTVMANDESGQ